MSQNHDFEPWQDTYQTGSTCPPKSRKGLIAFLLALVIFLCGISTALGLMNIRLFRSLQEATPEEAAAPVAFSQGQAEADSTFFCLGFSGQEIPELWCMYQNLPQGIYITRVDQNSDAAKKGILAGDILLCVDGQSVTTTQMLETLLSEKTEASAQIRLHRDGQQLDMTINFSKP